MFRNYDSRTGTISLIQKKKTSGAVSNPNKTESPSPRTRTLFIARTQEEMNRLEREQALDSEIMALGLYGEPQEMPILEMVQPQIQVEKETDSTKLPTEVTIENTPLPEPMVVKRRGRKKKSK
jgi:hypothetical protein